MQITTKLQITLSQQLLGVCWRNFAHMLVSPASFACYSETSTASLLVFENKKMLGWKSFEKIVDSKFNSGLIGACLSFGNPLETILSSFKAF